jgi:hypothetical protein
MVPGPKRQVKTPLLLLALLLTVVFALAAVWFYSVSTARTPILILANDLTRGEAVEASDLKITYIGTDDPVVAIPPDQSDTVVGRRALVDLYAGDIIHSGLVANSVNVPAGQGVVAMSLDRGGYPPGLVVGDAVDVVIAVSEAPSVVSGSVVDIRQPDAATSSDPSVVISVQVPLDASSLIAAAALDGKVALVQRAAS